MVYSWVLLKNDHEAYLWPPWHVAMWGGGPLQMCFSDRVEGKRGYFGPFTFASSRICAPSPQLCTLQIFWNLTCGILLLTCETSPQYVFFKEKYNTKHYGEDTVAWLLQGFWLWEMGFGLRRFHNCDCSDQQLNLTSFSSSSREGFTWGGWEGSRDDSDVPQPQRWVDQGGGDHF